MNAQPIRIAIALGCMGLVLLFAVRTPAIADAQTRGRDRVPSQLWRTYPLDPSRGQARIRGWTEADRQQAAEPNSVQTTPIGAKARDAEAQPSHADDDSPSMRTLAMIGFSLLALLGLVTLLVARYSTIPARNSSGGLIGVRGAISPSRSRAAIPHRRLEPSSPMPTTCRWSPASRRSRRPIRLASTLVGGSKRLGLRGASYGATAVHAPVRAGARGAAGLRWVALELFSQRWTILFGVLVILVSAAIGIGVSYFLRYL